MEFALRASKVSSYGEVKFCGFSAYRAEGKFHALNALYVRITLLVSRGRNA